MARHRNATTDPTKYRDGSEAPPVTPDNPADPDMTVAGAPPEGDIANSEQTIPSDPNPIPLVDPRGKLYSVVMNADGVQLFSREAAKWSEVVRNTRKLVALSKGFGDGATVCIRDNVGTIYWKSM